ncbi:MAG: hypothetical protein OZSIB_2897 [Candidatus Ozemobacter sibiricus]|uniref:DUF4185 domain-containing protein n=1 Tax=Candidatus Ozemobacter sibiricus TaxID=2268124 RepID=A0A367ZR05_9BACT|nr:MAG: hypothetical protein OZSIB_2897 [Candidatus Ozemobacter sibiricus]
MTRLGADRGHRSARLATTGFWWRARPWWLVLLALVGWSAPVASGAAPPAGKLWPDTALNARIRALPFFLGGDGCYTVPVPGRRLLVLFGDTFVGAGASRDRRRAAFINNTAAWADGDLAADTPLRFVRQRLPFLAPPASDTFVWPLDGIWQAGRLYLFAVEIRKVADGPFGFQEAGNHLYIVDTPDRPVEEWTWRRVAVPWARFAHPRQGSGKQRTALESVLWGGSLLADGDHILIYGVHQRADGRKSLVLARTDGSPDAFARWTFWQRSRGWQPAPHAPSPLLSPMPNEFTVFRTAQGYGLISSGDGGLSREIVQRDSPTPDFARARTRVIHRCTDHDRPDGVFCYSAKAVRRLDGGEPRLVVHFTNAATEDPLLRDLTLYWPVFHRLDGPPLASPRDP